MSSDARVLVHRAMTAVDAVERAEDFPGLAQVKCELARMLSVLEASTPEDGQRRNPGLSRLVTDSWPLGSSVSEAVVVAEQAFLGQR